MHKTIILGIESSCDDTSAAIIQDHKILSHITSHQEVHQKYGGVVPELASRAHQQNIVPVVQQALSQAKIHQKEISAIAFTRGPGLLGSLLVANSFSKSLAMSWGVPLIEVNHMQAHILAHFIEDANEKSPSFPFLALTVSGGHTQLVLVKDYFDMELLGNTLDDAVGEAFDKIGKMLDLGYPAGPTLDKLAKLGNPDAFTFPLPKVKGLDFSYSGIKTSVLYFLQKELKKDPNFIQNNLNDLCASVQNVLVQSLMLKVKKAIKETGVNHFVIAGGVSANSFLRTEAKKIQNDNLQVYIPKFEYTTDNAAMIAMVGSLKYKSKEFTDLEAVSVSKYHI